MSAPDYLGAWARGLPLLTADEERELAARRDAGDPGATQELIRRNTLLALRVAWAFRSRSPLPMDDLAAHAMIGLMKAADRFDPDKGRFTTVARRWILQSIQLGEVDEGHLIYVPKDVCEFVKSGNHPKKGRKPEAIEAAAELARFAFTASGRGLDQDSAWDPAHDVPVAGDHIEDADDADLSARLIAAVDSLPRRLRAVMRCRFGFGVRPMQFPEIASHLGITRWTVRADYAKALGLLREHLEAAGVAP